MNQRSDTDRLLRHWLADGPSTMPDRVVDVVADRIGRQPQRRSWRLRGRPFVNGYVKLAAGLAAAVVIAVVGYSLLPRQASIGGPSPTPIITPAPTATATAAPSIYCDEPGCTGPLGAGGHTALRFQPGLSFTTPSGWANTVDLPNLYMLTSNDIDYLMVWSDVAISQHTATCDPVALAGVGNKVQDWIDYVTTHPGILATGLAPVSLGGYQGQVVNLDVRSGWTQGCPNLDFKTVQFIMHADGGVGGTYGAAAGLRLRLYVLDVAGETVLVLHYGGRTEPDDIVASMRFTPKPAAS